MNFIKQIKEAYKNDKIIVIIFLFTVLSGAIRKWIITDSFTGNVILLIQLVILFWIIRKNKTSSITKSPLTIYLVVLFLLALNPLSKTIYHSALGFILHAGFWIAIFIYIYNRDNFKFENIVPIFMAIVVLEIVLGFLQYGLPSGNILNRYAVEDMRVATIGETARISGTFSYPAGYSSFILFIAFFIWALIKLNYSYIITISLTLFGIVISFMNGGRGPIVIYAFIILCAYLSNIKHLGRIIKYSIAIGILIFTIIMFSPKVFTKIKLSYDNWIYRTEYLNESGETNRRVFSSVLEVIDYDGPSPIFGCGLGGTYQGATKLWGTSDIIQSYGYYENEGPRIIIEGGFLLYILRIIMFGFLLNLLKIPKFFTSIFFIICVFYLPIVFNIYTVVFLFLGLAIVDKAYYIESQKKGLVK